MFLARHAAPSGADSHTVAPPTILTVSERATLLECESLIRENINGFFAVGNALRRIFRQELYREKYLTFAEYCRREWDITDRYARHLRAAAEVVSFLIDHDFAALPATESQARPLAELPEAEWRDAWEEVVGTAPEGRITAAHVREVVKRRVAKTSPKSSTAEAAKAPANLNGEAAAPQAPEPVAIDLPDLSTREKRIREQAAPALAEMRKLAAVIGEFDASAQTGVVVSIKFLEKLVKHADELEKAKAEKARAAEARAEEGLREHLPRVLEARAQAKEPEEA